MASHEMTLPQVLSRAVERSPDTEALVFPNTRITYRQLSDRVRATARSMLGMGIKPGDTVGVLMPNCVEHVTVFFASATIGALFVPINNRFRARELRHVIADSGMKALFTNNIVAEHVDYTERLNEALPELAGAEVGETPGAAAAPKLENIVLLGDDRAGGMITEAGFDSFGDSVSDDDLERAREAVTPALKLQMLYTSGTTSMPKGCPVSHNQLTKISQEVADHLGLVPGDRVWNALPMFHASSTLPMLASFHTTSTFVSQLHFTADQTLQQLVDEDITFAWPAYDLIWQQILTHPDFDASKLQKIRGLLMVGPPDTLKRMESILPNAKILNCYGITECTGIPVMCHHEQEQSVRIGTSGLPLGDMAAQIRDPETGKELPTGERGALWLHGEYVIEGYWNAPEKTAEAFDENHWFNTGDLGSIDKDGYIHFHGRIKDTLKVGGENVAAVEIEDYLSSHPAVKVAQVVGVPDPKLVEVPAAFIELKQGESVTEEELIDFCKGEISSFKVPRLVRFVTEWPMSATKIRKVDLRARLLEELGLDKDD